MKKSFYHLGASSSCYKAQLLFLSDFADLFPDRDIMFGDFTVISISQKTKADMTGWSEEVEVEREELLKSVSSHCKHMQSDLVV